MSYGHTNSPAATLKRVQHNFSYAYSPEESEQLAQQRRPSPVRIQKCTVGTSTSNEEAERANYRQLGLPTSATHHQFGTLRANPIEQSDPPRFQHNSPLSDALLLALRRSRPNTRLFRALFQYIPLRDSPNENPHLELPLHAGDYVLVHGQMDEDQFYFGETLSGRTGLVPSNYVERIPDYVLLQNASRAPSPSAAAPGCSQWNTSGPCCSTSGSLPRNTTTSQPHCCPNASSSSHLFCGGAKGNVGFAPSALSAHHSPVQTVTDALLANGVALPAVHGPTATSSSRPASPSFTLSVPPHHAQITHDFTDLDNKNVPLPDSVCPYPPVDVSKVTVQEIRNPAKPRVACPRELNVDKKLSRSVVVSWLPPDDQLTAVSQYHVCVDGVVKAVVPGTYKCKALIEDLSLDKFVNISIRSVTEGGQSVDAACTIAVGTEAPVAPQHVRVTNITPISACLSWYPSNSNAEHVVLLNALKIGVCPAAVFQVQLRGLTPSTIYRVSVRTKHPKAVLEQRPVERCVDFKTQHKIGLPDPPSSVQVEVGPQPGTLLISWRPVTTQPRPPSRAAVQSYLVYADGKNIAQVPSATADHVLLRLADFADDPPIFITVRTRTKEGVISADSNVVRVPRGAVTNSLSDVPTSAFANLNGLKYGGIGGNPLLNAPLTTSSLPNAFIGSGLPGVDLVGGQIPAISAPLNVMQPPAGLLTTLPQPPAQQTAASLNTAYGIGQPPVYLPQTGANPLAGQLNPQDAANAYILAAQPAQAGALTMQREDPAQWTLPTNRRISDSLFGRQPLQPHQMHATQHPHKFLERSSTSALLHNGSTQLPKYASVLDWKQAQQPLTQYYTFHPRTLYKELTTADEKPSVLEMENSYLLKHRQQQHHGFDTVPAYDHYGRPLPTRASAATIIPGSRRTVSGSGMMSVSQMVPRLSRVRSDEFLGTRSEPDLRPMPIYADEENCRWFVALYDYNHHMSPNPNAQQEELSFFKHQLIKVYGDVDQDGFYKGQIGRRYGLVPSNMVIEIAKDDLLPGARRLPPNEPDYHAPTGSSIADSAARRMRWGSMKSRSYDNAERRPPPQHTGAYPANGYSSLGRRDPHQYPSSSARYHDPNEPQLPGSSSIRAGAYAPRYPPSRDYRGAYERSSSYDPRAPQSRDYYGRRDARRAEGSGWEYPNDHRDTRDIREGAATVRGGERFDYAENQARYGIAPRAPPADYAARSYERGGQPGTSRDPYGVASDPATSTAGQQPPSQPGMQGPQPSAPPAPHQMGQQQAMPQSARGSLQQQPGQSLQQQQQGVQPQAQQQQQMMQQSAYPQSAQQQQQQPQAQQPGAGQPYTVDERFTRLDGPTKKLVAKYDYDSRQLSPNVDAEQVELSFRYGDVITVYGEMDDDGFYMGELNGVRGLVPSNFLQEMTGNSLTAANAMNTSGQGTPTTAMKPANAVGIMAGPTGAYGPVGDQTRPKGVMFSDTANRKPTPVRQTSQTSGKTSLTGVTAPSVSSVVAAKKPPSAPSTSKATTKKTDAKAAASSARKSSQAAKKDAPKKKA